jgi:predicted Zn-dependent protease
VPKLPVMGREFRFHKVWGCRLRLAAFLGMVMAGLGAGGCSTNPATGRSSFTGFMSASDEVKVGGDEHPKILQEFGGEYPDEKVRRYVQQVGERLAQVSETTGLTFKFTVLNSDVVNAFALPGGYVYITRGLLALGSTEAELAGVLGHEVGHIAARHTAERYSAAAASSLGVNIGAILLGVLTGSDALGQVAGQAGSNVAGLYLAKYSRSQESEADTLGVRYLARTGYDDNAMASFLSKLQADSALSATLSGRPGAENDFDIMQSHPRTADRVQAAIEEARKTGITTPNPRVGADDYLNVIDGLTWGGDRKSGWALDQVFIHPDLRIRFEVPPGFRLANTETSVTATGPDKSRILFSAVRRGADDRSTADNLSPSDYVGRVRIGSVGFSGIEAIKINGLDAATGAMRASTKDGQVDVRLVAIRVDPRTMYRFLFISPVARTAEVSTAFRRTTYSFRVLSAQEAASAHPPRVRVVKVAAGDNAESLAKRMALKDHAVERFRVLNGLQPTEQPRTGERVKIIVE